MKTYQYHGPGGHSTVPPSVLEVVVVVETEYDSPSVAIFATLTSTPLVTVVPTEKVDVWESD